MKVVSWNVNGIRSIYKRGFFLPFIESAKPDILCLQETKAQEHESPVDLPDYEEYWNSAKKKGYSGTAIFSKMKPLAVAFGFPEKFVKKFQLDADGYGDPNAEGRVISAEFEDFFVVNAYTPNAKRDLSRLSLRHTGWDPAFLAYCKELETKKPVIFCGDLNVAHTEDDLANPEANEGEHGFTKEERSGIDAIISAGFVDAFRQFTKGKGHYTWWAPFARARDRNIGWRIDYIFASKKLAKNLTSARIHPEVMGSDHCPVSVTIN